MNNAYYSVIGILAIVVQSIINNDLFRRKDYYNTKAHVYYRHFLVVAVIYYSVDALWGIFDGLGNKTLLYVDTIFYYLTMVITVIVWCRFVIEYLQMSKIMEKIINLIGIVLLVCEVILLCINHFVPIFFSIDSNCNYHAYGFRYGAMLLQILLFFMVSVQAMVGSNK